MYSIIAGVTRTVTVFRRDKCDADDLVRSIEGEMKVSSEAISSPINDERRTCACIEEKLEDDIPLTPFKSISNEYRCPIGTKPFKGLDTDSGDATPEEPEDERAKVRRHEPIASIV